MRHFFATLFIAAILFLAFLREGIAADTDNDAQWALLHSATVDLSSGYTSLQVEPTTRLKAIRITVSEGTVRLLGVRVGFSDGTAQNEVLNTELSKGATTSNIMVQYKHVAANQWQLSYPLKNTSVPDTVPSRTITNIDLTYASSHGATVIEVWSLPNTNPEPTSSTLVSTLSRQLETNEQETKRILDVTNSLIDALDRSVIEENKAEAKRLASGAKVVLASYHDAAVVAQKYIKETETNLVWNQPSPSTGEWTGDFMTPAPPGGYKLPPQGDVFTDFRPTGFEPKGNPQKARETTEKAIEITSTGAGLAAKAILVATVGPELANDQLGKLGPITAEKVERLHNGACAALGTCAPVEIFFGTHERAHRWS